MIKLNMQATKKIDVYIANLPEWEQRICRKLRQIIRGADPEIVETWRPMPSNAWGPSFDKHGMICGFGAFKDWVMLTFYQGALMKDGKKLFNAGQKNKRDRSIKFTDVLQIDEKALVAYIKEAVANNDAGRIFRMTPSKDKTVIVPDYFRDVLTKHQLLDKYQALPFYQRKEWVQWVKHAKKPETREKRIEKALDSIAKGVYM